MSRVERVVFYPVGLIICRSEDGLQAPSLQGLFPDVIDKIIQSFGPEDVKWVIIRDSKEVELSFKEWFETAQKMVTEDPIIETRPLSDEAMVKLRLLSTDQEIPNF